MDYERPAIVRRVPVGPPVIEGAADLVIGSPGGQGPSPVWRRDDTEGPGA